MFVFARYLLTAGAASLVDLAIAQSLLFVAMFQTGLFFGVPVVAGAAGGMAVNFLLSRQYVFETDERHAFDQARSFFIISVTTMLFKVMVAYALVALFALPLFGMIHALPVEAADSRLAQVISMGIVAIYSFFAHKHISFAGGIRRWLTNTRTAL